MGPRRKTVYWWRGSIDSHHKRWNFGCARHQSREQSLQNEGSCTWTESKTPKTMITTPQTFSANELAQSWEPWHKWFGHISYGRLQHMLDNNLVEGFSVDIQTQKPDCVACTESKQTVKPFSFTKGVSEKKLRISCWNFFNEQFGGLTNWLWELPSRYSNFLI